MTYNTIQHVEYPISIHSSLGPSALPAGVTNVQLIATLHALVPTLWETFKRRRVALPASDRVSIQVTPSCHGSCKSYTGSRNKRMYNITIPSWTFENQMVWFENTIEIEGPLYHYYMVHELCHAHTVHTGFGNHHDQRFYQAFSRVAPIQYHRLELAYKPRNAKRFLIGP